MSNMELTAWGIGALVFLGVLMFAVGSQLARIERMREFAEREEHRRKENEQLRLRQRELSIFPRARGLVGHPDGKGDLPYPRDTYREGYLREVTERTTEEESSKVCQDRPTYGGELHTLYIHGSSGGDSSGSSSSECSSSSDSSSSSCDSGSSS